MTRTTTKSARAVRLDEHVDGIVSSIGPRLKHLRQERHFSLQQLAARAEVSAAAIHKIERNDMVPTITTLLKIATALDRPVSYFVDSDEGPREPVAFTPAGNRPAVDTPHAGLSLAGVSGPYTPFRSAAAVATVEAGANSGDRPLVHPGEELIFVLEGELTFDIASTRYRLGRGDALHFIGDQDHHWVNEGKTRARAVWIALRDS
jgi:DNA-binding XRE family transcriptional regulator/quercetin dioxygenase-like cupin family protein